MAEAVRSQAIIDDRGRTLRASWHQEENVVVLSLWRESACVGTVRLTADDASILSTFLVESWIEGLRRSLASSGDS